MSAFSIELGRQAASYFSRLGKDLQARVGAKLREIAADHEAESKKLVNRSGARSARVGNLRILFDVNESLRRIEVTAILPRGDVYKRTGN